MTSTSLWLPSRLLGLVNAFSITSLASLFQYQPSARRTERWPARWLNEAGLERWSREMNPASVSISREPDVLPRGERAVDYTGLTIPWPRARWPFELFQSSPRRARPELEPTPSHHEHDPSMPSSKPQKQDPAPKEPPKPPKEKVEIPRSRDDPIHLLMRNPALRDPLRAPRYPIVLCHGLYGFDVRGPSAIPAFRMHYWSDVRNILRKTVGADLIIGSVPGTGSIASRAAELDRFLKKRAHGRGVNFLGHSMGGLDGRHLITHIRPREYAPLSLTTVGTPHRGSPFMDWCQDYLGVGRLKDDALPPPPKATEWDEVADLAPWPTEYDHPPANSSTSGSSSSWFSVPSSSSAPPPEPERDEPSAASKSALASLSLASLPGSLTTRVLGMFDSPAYANLSTHYLEHVFNPRTPDDPRVRYFSVGGRAPRLNVWHPLWLPKLVVDGWEERARAKEGSEFARDRSGWGNDGLVTVRSARWGEYLGTLHDADHWRLRGAGGFELGDHLSMPSLDLVSSQFSRLARAVGYEMAEEERAARSQEDAAARDRARGDAAKAAEEQRSADTLRRSTERLSEVVDWLVDSVPSVPTDALKIPTLSFARAAAEEQGHVEREKAEKRERVREKGDLEEDGDLERFYIALARKLYDEGL